MIEFTWTRTAKKRRRAWYMAGRYTPVFREMRNTSFTRRLE